MKNEYILRQQRLNNRFICCRMSLLAGAFQFKERKNISCTIMHKYIGKGKIPIIGNISLSMYNESFL